MAADFYATLSDYSRSDFESFQEALTRHFGPTELDFIERQELSSRLQKPDEPLDKYSSFIQQRCHRLLIAPQECLHYLANGLLPQLREYVLLNKPKTFEEAEELARLRDSVTKTTESKTDVAAAKLLQGLIESAKTPKVAAAQSSSVPPSDQSFYQTLGELKDSIDDLKDHISMRDFHVNTDPPFSRNRPQNFQRDYHSRPPPNRGPPNSYRSHSSQRGRGGFANHSQGSRTRDGKPICSRCHRPGHLASSCTVWVPFRNTQQTNKFVRKGDNRQTTCRTNFQFSQHHPNMTYFVADDTDQNSLSPQISVPTERDPLLPPIADQINPPLSLQASVNFTPAQCLVDTGAQISVIRACLHEPGLAPTRRRGSALLQSNLFKRLHELSRQPGSTRLGG